MAGQAQRITELERRVAELQERFEVTRIGLEHVFAAGAEMRRGAALRADLIEAVEARAYARSSQPAKTPQAERWLHAVPELEAGA
jgi:hypothetical protein